MYASRRLDAGQFLILPRLRIRPDGNWRYFGCSPDDGSYAWLAAVVVAAAEEESYGGYSQSVCTIGT
jgi:hypothetical protein